MGSVLCSLDQPEYLICCSVWQYSGSALIRYGYFWASRIRSILQNTYYVNKLKIRSLYFLPLVIRGFYLLVYKLSGSHVEFEKIVLDNNRCEIGRIFIRTWRQDTEPRIWIRTKYLRIRLPVVAGVPLEVLEVQLMSLFMLSVVNGEIRQIFISWNSCTSRRSLPCRLQQLSLLLEGAQKQLGCG
jgi:hypothetical protein